MDLYLIQLGFNSLPKIWTKADKDGSSTAVFRSRLEQKSPVTECLVCCVCVLFFFFYEEIYGKNG